MQKRLLGSIQKAEDPINVRIERNEHPTFLLIGNWSYLVFTFILKKTLVKYSLK